jgi:hypothetical protein
MKRGNPAATRTSCSHSITPRTITNHAAESSTQSARGVDARLSDDLPAASARRERRNYRDAGARSALDEFFINRARTIDPNIDATSSETRCSPGSRRTPRAARTALTRRRGIALGKDAASSSWHRTPGGFSLGHRGGHRCTPSQNTRSAPALRRNRPRGRPERRPNRLRQGLSTGTLAKTSLPVISDTSEGGTVIACRRLRVPLPSAPVTRTTFGAVLIRFEEAVAAKDLPVVEA